MSIEISSTKHYYKIITSNVIRIHFFIILYNDKHFSNQTFAEDGLLNIIGGCCGTTPEHIQ